MIRATAGTWANYATTVVFQILFAGHFGTSNAASAFVIALALAVSASGVFITTTLAVIVPRMLTQEGAISRRAVIALGVFALGATVISAGIALVGLVAPAAALDAFIPGGAQDGRAFLVLAGLLTVLLALAGMLSAVALARGHRFFPAVAPGLPSTIGAAYLIISAQPTATSALAAVAFGALLQCVLAAGLAVVPRPRIIDTAPLRTRSLAIWTFLLLFGLNLLPPLQRIVASAFDAPGAAQYDYASRGLQVVLQLLVGGLALASLADWSRGMGSGRLREGASRATATAGLLLVTAGSIIAVSAQPLVAAILERGAFDEADTLAVSTLLVILVPGFIAEGLTIVLTQAVLAANFTRIYLRVNFSRLVLHVILIVTLGTNFGARGVAVAYVIALLATFLMTAAAAFRIGLFRDHADLLARAGGASILVAIGGVALTVFVSGLPIASVVGVLAVFSIALLAFRLDEVVPGAHLRGFRPTSKGDT